MRCCSEAFSSFWGHKQAEWRENLRNKEVFLRDLKGSGIWWICYADANSQIHREKVGMRQAAVNVYQLRLGKFVPEDVTIKHKITSVAEIIDDYLKASEAMMRKSIDDIRQRSGWWKQHLNARPANGIVKQDIENARLELSKNRLPSNGQRQKAGGRSAATVNR
jgi:hypothetical protein